MRSADRTANRVIVLVRGYSVLEGYYKDPEKTAPGDRP